MVSSLKFQWKISSSAIGSLMVGSSKFKRKVCRTSDENFRRWLLKVQQLVHRNSDEIQTKHFFTGSQNSYKTFRHGIAKVRQLFHQKSDKGQCVYRTYNEVCTKLLKTIFFYPSCHPIHVAISCYICNFSCFLHECYWRELIYQSATRMEDW